MSTHITYEQLPLDSIETEDYMRPLDARRWSRMAHNWKPRLAQALIVVRDTSNGNPLNVLIDGNHRKAAAQYRGINELWCQVEEGPIPRAERARLFYDVQEARKNLTALDRYRALLAAEDELTLSIKALLDKHGVSVIDRRLKHDPEHISAVQTLYIAHGGTPPGVGLDRALGLIVQYWIERDGHFDGQLLLALSRVLSLGARMFDDQTMFLNAFRKGVMEQWTPLALLREARTLQVDNHKQMGLQVVLQRILVRETNKHLPPEQQLPDQSK